MLPPASSWIRIPDFLPGHNNYSVADPDPNPSDPYVFGPPGSGSRLFAWTSNYGVADPDPNPYVFGPPGSGSVSQRLRGMDPDTGLLAWTIGYRYIDFNNIMGFDSKNLPYNIIKKCFLKNKHFVNFKAKFARSGSKCKKIFFL
jgi:hypothetical protein